MRFFVFIVVAIMCDILLQSTNSIFHSLETYRRYTFKQFKHFQRLSFPLARAGFYALNTFQAKCYACNYAISLKFKQNDIIVEYNDEDVILVTEQNECYIFWDIHEINREQCAFLRDKKSVISKKFYNPVHNLYFEKERLDSYVEWPVLFINPQKLAASGFYYLRQNDDVACIYCNGIIGCWEIDDDPDEEHLKHFPHCKFINGKALFNVNLKQSNILDDLVKDDEDFPIPGEIVERSDDLHEFVIGARQYHTPLIPRYSKLEDRIKSFVKWPTRLVQRPKQLAEAGFFYCKLSDHVKCFYCAGGLKNWEVDDDPWEQHARWYPKCLFVIIKKGIDFVNRIQSTKPRAVKFHSNNTIRIVTASSGEFRPVSDQHLKILLHESLYIKNLIRSYTFVQIRRAFRNKINKTGLPFFNEDEIYNYIDNLTKEEVNEELKKDEEDLWDIQNLLSISQPITTVVARKKNIVIPEENEVKTITNSCKICYDDEIEIIFIPCRHMICCKYCIFKLEDNVCPICNEKISYIIKPIF